MARILLALCLLSGAFAFATAQTSAHSVGLSIAAADRAANKASVAAVLTFTTLGAIPVNGKITLNYPSGFFAISAIPTVSAIGGGTASPSATCAAPTATAIVITTATGTFATMTAVTISLSGLTMGAANAGSATGITVSTDSDTVASVGVPSGTIGAPTGVSLTITAADRIAAKSSVTSVVLAFTTTAALAQNGLITLNYPTGFFDVSATPTVSAIGGGTASPTATCATPTATAIVITTATGNFLAGASVTITFAGVKMGAATAGSLTGITVSTTTDTAASLGVSSGVISSPTGVILTIAAADRQEKQAGVTATLAFTATAALAVNGKITLNYPTGFFDTSATPTVSAIGGGTASPTATCAAPTATAIVITTATGNFVAGASVTITFAGVKMGAATAGSATGITVSTDTDTAASAGVTSGLINPAVTSVGFVIAAAKRVPASTAAALTLSFKTTSAFQIGGRITVTYPSGFFAAVTATANAAGTTSVAAMTAAAAAAGATSVVITTAVAGIAAGTTFTITISGLTMGAATAGGSVTVQTDTDPAPSASVLSGGLGTQATAFTATASSTALATASTTLVIAFTTTTTVLSAGTISFWFPTGWYDTTAAPTANLAGTSSVAALTASSAFSGNKITITTAAAAIPATTAFTITLSGLKTGATAVAAGKYTLATSGDTVGLEIDSPALGAASAPGNTKSSSSVLTVTVSVFAFVSLMLML